MEGNKSTDELQPAFKKPLLVGKIGKLPKQLHKKSAVSDTEETEVEAPNREPTEPKADSTKTLGYEEPPWSGLPEPTQQEYVLEVLKNGSIIETISLMKKSFWLFGRLANCDICMQHPTISRHHAVLQYRGEKSDSASMGYYVYDLESTHGTFLNKNRIRPRSYVKMHVGHMLKLGCSTRTYILNGPVEDAEEESELSITELKQKRLEELRQRELLKQKQEELKKKQEERGIDWGLGEDAEEETDLSENPFAQTNNEDIYIDNPKKALRGFFEREGLELEYDCTEQGMGQFLCKVELPIDDEMGRPIFAEVFHKGKKKEAVIQCALEGCRILDRHGVLRQATHESRKRKPKNWEENDYYDSDEDTFLDRTGSIEKKRERRMNAKAPQKAETYESLLEKENAIAASIRSLEVELAAAVKKQNADEEAADSEVDPLDSFMMELKQSKPNKQTVNKLKADLSKLKHEHSNVIKLVNIAKPASLPPLVANYEAQAAGSADKKAISLPIFGKRKKIKVQVAAKSVEQEKPAVGDDEREEEEEEEEEDTVAPTSTKVESKKPNLEDDEDEESEKSQKEIDERRRRRNQRRIQQKQEKAQIQKQKGYAEDANKEDYNMWVPPRGQTGDGRTALNDKYGY